MLIYELSPHFSGADNLQTDFRLRQMLYMLFILYGNISTLCGLLDLT